MLQPMLSPCGGVSFAHSGCWTSQARRPAVNDRRLLSAFFPLLSLFLGGLMSLVMSADTALAQVVDEVLVGAADITNCGLTHDESTPQLLDTIPGTVVTMGDNRY